MPEEHTSEIVIKLSVKMKTSSLGLHVSEAYTRNRRVLARTHLFLEETSDTFRQDGGAVERTQPCGHAHPNSGHRGVRTRLRARKQQEGRPPFYVLPGYAAAWDGRDEHAGAGPRGHYRNRRTFLFSAAGFELDLTKRANTEEQGRPQSLGESDKSNGKEIKNLDWSKDTGDTFYLLTEESELSSTEGHSLNDSGSSISSEEGNASSNNELTVRQRYRQRKCIKTRFDLQEGTEFSASSGSRTLKWDYSSINLTDVACTTNKPNMSDQQSPGNNDRGDNIEAAKSDICAANTDSGMLQSIFNSIKEFQTETRVESRRARMATKQLQGSVRKVAKSCIEIETKLCTMEERIVAVEEDVDSLKQQNAMQESQMTDVMWKLEDLENRHRRNNLRFLGIEEGLEGNDIQDYMIKLLQRAFPELNHWD
ncbi:hypothetical protein NDU88_004001 [Pleurodeles waltl]|uniref:Uncharacterized protein n=1 Tax=Pleurodeles waltl TaxID=8319 RepID=A0AAV7W564_PLEWA|nr:hypothetical protein NDU88_004001 [Pleurodeles waltl]